MIKKGIFRGFLFLFVIVMPLLPFVRQVFAQEKPEIFVDTGIIGSVKAISISPDARYLAIITETPTFDRQLEVYLYDTVSERQYKKKIIETSLPFSHTIESFFSDKGGYLFLLIDKGKDVDIELIIFNIHNDDIEYKKVDWHAFINIILESEKEDYTKLHLKEMLGSPIRFLALKPHHFSYFLEKYGFKSFVNESLSYLRETSKGEISFKLYEDDKENYDLEIKKYTRVLFKLEQLYLYPPPVITPDGRFLAAIKKTGDFRYSIYFYDVASNKVKIFTTPLILQEYIVKGIFDNYLCSYDYRNKSEFIVWDIKNAMLIKKDATTKDVKKLCNPEKDKDGDILLTQKEVFSKHRQHKLKISSSYDYVSIYDTKLNNEIAKFYLFTDGEWIVITPEGYYNASPNGDKHLNVRIGNNVYSIENYREAFYRPDLVKIALTGGSLKEFKNLADVKQPPIVEIVDAPLSTAKDEIKVTLKLTDQGGGIGDVRLYLNGSAVVLDSARGIAIKPKPGEKDIYKTYTIRLTNGENVIKAVAFNAENTMQSNPAIHKIVASIGIKKPSMYAVVIGINEYKNPKLELKYAVADAKLFAETLKQIATPLFEKVEIKLLATKDETTKDSIKNALSQMKKLRPEDVFVFYVASHGTVDEGEYFLITSNVGSLSTFRLKEDALTQTELKELIANVPSTKKLIVIDTCSAGKLGEALQVAMLTRGMSEETAMKILSHAVGSTIISASTALQEAMEGYQGHGLFTYVLTEGMKGKADTDRDGFIKTLELANYADSEVPLLAEKVFKKAQYPTATPSGQAFPVGKVR